MNGISLKETTLLQTTKAEFKALLYSRLSMSFGTRVFNTIIQCIDFIAVDGSKFVFETKNEDVATKVKTIYFEKFKRVVCRAAVDILLITPSEIIINFSCKTNSNSLHRDDSNQDKTTQNAAIVSIPNNRLNANLSNANFNAEKPSFSSISTEINTEKYNFENFITTKQNSISLRMARDFCSTIIGQKQCDIEQNLLFVNGSVGNGKTHLLQSCGGFLSKHGKTITYLTADKFVFNYVKAIQNGKMIEFKDQIFLSDILIVDDIHFVAGKKSSIEELYNLVSSLLNDGKAVIVSSIHSVNSINFNSVKGAETLNAMEGINARFKSILHSGISCNVPNPSSELRREIIAKKMNDFAIPNKTEIIDFLTTNITSNIRDIESAIRKIKINAQYVSKNIDLAFVKSTLEDFLYSFKKIVSPADIINAVCKEFQIQAFELSNESKIKDLSIPRQICMGLLKEFTTLSYQEISSVFAKKSHTTVIHAVASFEKLKLNPTFAVIIEKICSQLKDGLYAS